MENAIQIKDVTKIYRIYENPKDRIKEILGIGKQKYYDDFYALDKVSFDVHKGEIVGIIGRNGSGKSTILKILTGVLSPTSGEVNIDGKISALLELGAGFNAEYTGMENIYLNATMMKVKREDIEKKIPDILAFADIGDYINQPVKTYSSGMFVRLAFAVAINVDPDILIVDEALAVGDARFQMKCMDKFLEFVNAGKTILFVSHDINSIKRFCNRVVWLNNGKVIMDGNTDEITDRYMDFLKSDMVIEDYLNHCEQELQKDEINNSEVLSGIDIDGVDIAEILDIKVFNDAEREIDDIIHGESIKLKVRYVVSDETIDEPLLGVAIRRIDNEYICGINTKLDNKHIPWRKGLNEIELKYECFNLVGGEYYFDIGIFDKTGIVNIDYKAKIKSFFVKMDYIAEGIVVLNHQWKTI